MVSVISKVYNALPGEKPTYGSTQGTCRITGLQSVGVPFQKWVPDTFTDYPFLKPGDIVSNEAAYFFAEKNEHLQAILGKDNAQKVRSYSVIIHAGALHFCTKADKKRIYEMVCDGAELVCLAESGQKHILFKHRPGFWQLEGVNNITPDIPTLQMLMQTAHALMALGFTQTECITGHYASYKLMKHPKPLSAIQEMDGYEAILKQHRGSAFFDFFSFILYKPETTDAK